jgi:signal transduction histidine kinase
MEENETRQVLTREEKVLTIMAHDIKTPLTAVVSLLGVIKKGYVDNDTEKMKELVTRASKQAESLIAMLDDILDYALLADKSKIRREPVHLFEVFKDSISAMKTYVDRKHIVFTYDPRLGKEQYIYGNRTFLLRAFNNILMNAIKYNIEQGTITIDSRENPSQNTTTIKFIDTGIGIPTEDLEKVFKIFERGRQARRNLDGSLGLGLSLVKQIINFHRGEITIDSAVDKGTTLTVTLPLFKKEKQGGTHES